MYTLIFWFVHVENICSSFSFIKPSYAPAQNETARADNNELKTANSFTLTPQINRDSGVRRRRVAPKMSAPASLACASLTRKCCWTCRGQNARLAALRLFACVKMDYVIRWCGCHARATVRDFVLFVLVRHVVVVVFFPTVRWLVGSCPGVGVD